MLLKIIILIFCANTSKSDSYWTKRKQILEKENRLSLGGDVSLTVKEMLANEGLLKLKKGDFIEDLKNISSYPPQGHFFQTKEKIEKSKVFSILKMVPKAASLHTHLLAAVSFEYLFNNLTYRENLYACVFNERLKLKFFSLENQSDLCRWELIENLRKKNDSYNDWVRNQLSLQVENPREIYTDIHVVWKVFRGIFSTTFDLFSYRPIFVDYIHQVLNELHSDNVFYVEFRGVPLKLYELNGTVHDENYFFDTFLNVINTFKKNNPSFFGAKFIYSPYRKIDTATAENCINNFLRLKYKYSDFIVGFDLVGFEEEGKALRDFVPLFLNVKTKVNFFFHAGETNWYGTEIDLNILDAVMLNSNRIAHGYSIVKHPEISKLVLEKDIAIEICPISNQVLMLVDDMRNHPGNILISQGYPIVVCNDDPGFWGAKGLSYDWYMVFMGMSRMDSGLELLKQLANNSIKYSALNNDEKKEAFLLWEKRWQIFIENILNNTQNFM